MTLREKCKIISFAELGDDRGKLVALESSKNIPFTIRRVFYIFGTTDGTIRGQHANKKSTFLLICVSGSCKVRLYEEGDECIVELNQPNVGLLIPTMVWKDMYDFSPDCVLLSLSDQPYDSSEYIRREQ